MKYKDCLINNYNIDECVIDLVQKSESLLAERFAEIDDITAICQMKVLKAFQDNHINATHFDWSTGYGYDDAGREAFFAWLDAAYAEYEKTHQGITGDGNIDIGDFMGNGN